MSKKQILKLINTTKSNLKNIENMVQLAKENHAECKLYIEKKELQDLNLWLHIKLEMIRHQEIKKAIVKTKNEINNVQQLIHDAAEPGKLRQLYLRLRELQTRQSRHLDQIGWDCDEPLN